MAAASESCSEKHTSYEWRTEAYLHQWRKFWPKDGRHILAQYDDNTVLLYQAFKPEIAEYAVLNQRFGGPAFSFSRMSWIKTNFLWMMYRCGWAQKANQERVLAVRIKRDGFDTILANAYSTQLQKSEGLSSDEIQVRLQWDPDHTPTYEKEDRKAIQLGLKGDILQKYATEWIVEIQDVTRSVKDFHKVLKQGGTEALLVARERVYRPLCNPDYICQRIQLSWFEDPLPTASSSSKTTRTETDETVQTSNTLSESSDGCT